MASRKRTPAKAGKRTVALGKTKPNGKSLNGKHAKHVNGKTNGTASVLAVQVPKARKDQLKSKTPPAKRGDTVKSQIVLPVGYRPTDDEPFMNERQRIYFR
jgi:DnaK suppressor protein